MPLGSATHESHKGILRRLRKEIHPEYTYESTSFIKWNSGGFILHQLQHLIQMSCTIGHNKNSMIHRLHGSPNENTGRQTT